MSSRLTSVTPSPARSACSGRWPRTSGSSSAVIGCRAKKAKACAPIIFVAGGGGGNPFLAPPESLEGYQLFQSILVGETYPAEKGKRALLGQPSLA